MKVRWGMDSFFIRTFFLYLLDKKIKSTKTPKSYKYVEPYPDSLRPSGDWYRTMEIEGRESKTVVPLDLGTSTIPFLPWDIVVFGGHRQCGSKNRNIIILGKGNTGVFIFKILSQKGVPHYT